MAVRFSGGWSPGRNYKLLPALATNSPPDYSLNASRPSPIKATKLWCVGTDLFKASHSGRGGGVSRRRGCVWKCRSFKRTQSVLLCRGGVSPPEKNKVSSSTTHKQKNLLILIHSYLKSFLPTFFTKKCGAYFFYKKNRLRSGEHSLFCN